MPVTTRSKLPYPSATDPADVPTDLQKLAVALDEIAYAEITTNKSVTATADASADIVVAAPAITFDGATAVIVTCSSPVIVPASVAGNAVFAVLFQDGAPIGRMGAVLAWASVAAGSPLYVQRRLTPTAGSHTYAFAAIVAGGAGTVFAGAAGSGNYLPAYIRITRV